MVLVKFLSVCEFIGGDGAQLVLQQCRKVFLMAVEGIFGMSFWNSWRCFCNGLRAVAAAGTFGGALDSEDAS